MTDEPIAIETHAHCITKKVSLFISFHLCALILIPLMLFKMAVLVSLRRVFLAAGGRQFVVCLHIQKSFWNIIILMLINMN